MAKLKIIYRANRVLTQHPLTGTISGDTTEIPPSKSAVLREISPPSAAIPYTTLYRERQLGERNIRQPLRRHILFLFRDVAHVHVFHDFFGAALAAEAGFLDVTEGGGGIGDRATVNPYNAGV